MPSSQVPLLCPFCGEGLTVARGAFPFVCSQLLVKFERCQGLPAGTSHEEIAAAAEGIADELLSHSARFVLPPWAAQFATPARGTSTPIGT